MHNLVLTLSVDDVNPSPQYRLLGTPAEKWFRSLHNEFGVKFTLFCPSNYHQQWPISEHKGWVNEINYIDWLEIAAHGHSHQTTNPKKYGECEWVELSGYEAKERMLMLENEWSDCGFMPIGWRSPGWLINPSNVQIISDSFEYAAIHYEHNNGLKWGCKTFYGHDGIHQENIGIHNENMIMFQSHIAGKHNHNVWNEQNYEQLRLSLSHLFENYEIESKLLKECLND